MRSGSTIAAFLAMALLASGAALAQEPAPKPPPEKKKPKKVWTNDDFPARPRPQPQPAETSKPAATTPEKKATPQRELTPEEREKRIAALEEDIRLTSEYIAYLRDTIPQVSDDAERTRMREEMEKMEAEVARMRQELEALRTPPRKQPARSTPPASSLSRL